MKNLQILVILIFCSFSVAQAQTEKGRWTVGAQVGTFTFQSKSNFKSFAANLMPTAGYFIADGLAIGVGIPLGISTQKTDEGGYYYNKISSKTFGAAPFIRYFLGKSIVKPYVGLSYSYKRTSGKGENDDMTGQYELTTKGKSTALIPAAGVAFFINRNLALSLEADYNINHQEQHTDYSVVYASSSYNTDTRSLSLAVGFQLFLGK